jgi:hypothetical protein
LRKSTIRVKHFVYVLNSAENARQKLNDPAANDSGMNATRRFAPPAFPNSLWEQ